MMRNVPTIKIRVPVDSSAYSDRALRQRLDIGKQYNATEMMKIVTNFRQGIPYEEILAGMKAHGMIEPIVMASLGRLVTATYHIGSVVRNVLNGAGSQTLLT